MTANTPAAYGMYPEDVALQQVVQTLNQSGFHKEDICMMVSPAHPIATTMREANILTADREASATTAGLMRWLLEFGAVMIPTVGFFVRSQGFLQALVREDAPARWGSSRTLVGLGFPERDAERFENQLREMGVLVYVVCPGDEAKTSRAAEVLRRTGAQETATLEKQMAAEAAA
ncbi:MAG: hypothetical protein WB562_15760 [Candidatus Sulfotelmatobacter sp.]